MDIQLTPDSASHPDNQVELAQIIEEEIHQVEVLSDVPVPVPANQKNFHKFYNDKSLLAWKDKIRSFFLSAEFVGSLKPSLWSN